MNGDPGSGRQAPAGNDDVELSDAPSPGPGHPVRPRHRPGDPGLLEMALKFTEAVLDEAYPVYSHQRHPVLAARALLLLARFERDRDFAVLLAAQQAAREVRAQFKPEDPQYLQLIYSWGDMLADAYRQTGEPRLMSESVGLYLTDGMNHLKGNQSAVPDVARLMARVAAADLVCYWDIGNATWANDAVDAAQGALTLTPHDSQERPARTWLYQQARAAAEQIPPDQETRARVISALTR
jgi:hypothetical protein